MKCMQVAEMQVKEKLKNSLKLTMLREKKNKTDKTGRKWILFNFKNQMPKRKKYGMYKKNSCDM